MADGLARLGALAENPVVRTLAEAFDEAGFELAVVGGPVRDALLGRETHDLDFTTSASPDEILAIVKPVASAHWDIGRAFGTIGARVRGEQVEITTYRADSYDGVTRKPTVEFGDSIDGDLLRRDFTVNAMALQVPAVKLVDPTGGVEDLVAGVLRTPTDPRVSFGDDPLRMLRAARFSAQLGFTVEEDTERAITELRETLTIVSPERVQSELVRLMQTADPVRGIRVLVETGLIEEFLPEEPRGPGGCAAADRGSAPRHRQAPHAQARAGWRGDLPPPRRRRRTDGTQAAAGPAFRLGDHGCRRDPDRAASAVLRLCGGGVDGCRRAPLRPRCRGPAGAAAHPHARRRHHAEQAQGRSARRRLRRHRVPDRGSSRAGGARRDPSGARRQPHPGGPRHLSGPGGRRGVPVPPRSAPRRGRAGRGRRGAASPRVVGFARLTPADPPPSAHPGPLRTHAEGREDRRGVGQPQLMIAAASGGRVRDEGVLVRAAVARRSCDVGGTANVAGVGERFTSTDTPPRSMR
ncbi:unnamed protein product [Penicillium discolor]